MNLGVQQETLQPTLLRFGPFEVDLRAGDLRKHGIRIKLQDKPFQFLALLLERPGELITREQLRERLWPADTFVDFEGSLNTAANRLRQALSDSADLPRFIETVPRKGYRFIAPVAAVDGVSAASRQNAYVRERENEAGGVSRWRKFLVPAVALFVLSVIVPAALFITGRAWTGRSKASGKVMLAVLPFENLSNDPQQEYFSDGLTDEMIAQLGQLQPARLAVIGRTSAMRFKGSREGAAQIAGGLGVDYVLAGSVRRSNGRVRITAQLIQARDQTNLWAETYEREMSDVLEIQRDVAARIASSLALELLPGERAVLSRPAANPAAYEAYLMGRYYWDKRTAASLEKAREHFEQAAALDPNYSPAYAGLADTYLMLANQTILSPKQAYPKARQAAEKALQLDEKLADAHVSLAGIVWWYDWKWPEAESHFQRAIELNPGYATAHQWYAEFLSAAGRHQEAAEEIRRALLLDPLSLTVNTSAGMISYYARQYDAALAQCKRTVEMDGEFAPARICLVLVYVAKSMFREAAEQRRLAMVPQGFSKEEADSFQRAFDTDGVDGARRWLIDWRERRMKTQYIPAYLVASLYAFMNQPEKAFLWLEKSLEQRDSMLVYLKVDPAFDSLRSDRRFPAMLRRVGLA